MEAGPRTVRQKRLAPNQRVSGAVGEFIDTGPSKRRRRERWFGHVIEAVGERKYLVRFDNGQEKELPSNVLKVEDMVASLPPDVLLPIPQNVREVTNLENAEADLLDVEESEDLPTATPEEEDAEADEEQHQETEAVENNNEATNEPESQHDPNGRMPGQLPTEAAATVKDYTSIKKAAKEKVLALVGTEVSVVSKKNGTMKWTVVENHTPPEEKLISKGTLPYGLKDFSLANHKKSEILVDIFLQLSFLNWKSKVDKMNREVESSKCKCKKFSYEEFLIGLGLMIGAAEFSQKGVDLFGGKKGEEDDEDLDEWPSISPNPHFEKFMAFSRFKDFRRFLPSIYAEGSRKESDLWWEFSGAIDEFNVIRSTKLICSHWISADETMCAWRPRTTALGGLPNISFVVRKPEPLGKLLFCYDTILINVLAQ
jgi:hypothetical protein